MNRGDAILRRCFATALAALMVTLSVVMPVLDRVDVSPYPVAETEHTPTECLEGHDHLICGQIGANHAAAASDPGRHHGHRIERLVTWQLGPGATQALLPEANPSRAPPKA
jgi:hypothetical protein